MNALELALLEPSNERLDFYLKVESTRNIRTHIEEIIEKAQGQTEAGVIKKKLMELIDSI